MPRRGDELAQRMSAVRLVCVDISHIDAEQWRSRGGTV
jgi:hypothetical protein